MLGDKRASSEVVKEEGRDHLWRSSISDHDHQRVNSSFLDGFSELDGFYDDHLCEFPSLPQLRSSRMDGFQELDPKL